MMRCLNHHIPGAEAERTLAFAGIVAQAVAELIRQGYTPFTFSGDALGAGLPVIQVVADSRTRQAVATERATYYKYATDADGPKRWGQLLNAPPGVRAIFVERVSS